MPATQCRLCAPERETGPSTLSDAAAASAPGCCSPYRTRAARRPPGNCPVLWGPCGLRPARRQPETLEPWLATARSGELRSGRPGLALFPGNVALIPRAISSHFPLDSRLDRFRIASHIIDKKDGEQAKLCGGLSLEGCSFFCPTLLPLF